MVFVCLSCSNLSTNSFLKAFILRVLRKFLFMICHKFVILAIIGCLHLLDKQVNEVEQIDLIQLFLTIFVYIKVDIYIRLL